MAVPCGLMDATLLPHAGFLIQTTAESTTTPLVVVLNWTAKLCPQ